MSAGSTGRTLLIVRMCTVFVLNFRAQFCSGRRAYSMTYTVSCRRDGCWRICGFCKRRHGTMVVVVVGRFRRTAHVGVCLLRFTWNFAGYHVESIRRCGLAGVNAEGHALPLKDACRTTRRRERSMLKACFCGVCRIASFGFQDSSHTRRGGVLCS